MPPLLRPSPPPSKEPPDKTNTYLPLSAPRPTINTSQGMPPSQPQPPASPSTRPPFSPFFTLIHDTATATTHHPRNVHYIFSDDDPSLLTTACLSALSPSPQPGTSPTASNPNLTRPPRPTQNPSPSSSSAASKSPSSSTASKPVRERERENRILLLDLDESGTSVTKAHSLSSSWQIISTSLTPAPTWDESPSEPSPPNAGGAGFMLKVSGTDGRQMSTGGMGTGLGLGHGRGESKGGEGKGGAGMTEAEFQALMLEFDSRMKVLRTVVEAGVEVGQQREGREEGEAEGEATVERGGESAGAGGVL